MTEVKFGEDLLRQVELFNGAPPEDSELNDVEFDEKGTVHLMYRNNDGKLLGDVSIKETSNIRRHKDELYEEYRDSHEEITRITKKTNILLIAVGVGLLTLTVLCMFIIWRLSNVF